MALREGHVRGTATVVLDDGPDEIGSRFPERLERFEAVGSTNDVVAGWLAAGAREVCVAVADRQSAGRGRLGRTWLAPAGAALLASFGFRPSWLAPDRAWRLAAIVALAAADAGEEVAGLAEGTIRLKWPNDLVVESDGRVRKLAGLLGETEGLGGPDPRVVIGLGLNADWASAEFPSELADEMTSLREASGGRPIDRDVLLGALLDRLATRLDALRSGWFDLAGWSERQLTNGRPVRLDKPDGSSEVVRAVAVDGLSGGLVVEAGDTDRVVLVGEIRHVRVGDGV